MPLSSEEIQVAEKMRRFVRSREQMTGWPSVVNAGVLLLLFAIGCDDLRRGREMGYFMLGAAFVSALMHVVGHFLARERCATYRTLLAILERDHGDELPWRAEEKILREAGRFEQELAKHPAAP